MNDELQYEWSVVYETRLGLLCGSDTPTPEQEAMAKAESDKAIEELKEL